MIYNEKEIEGIPSVLNSLNNFCVSKVDIAEFNENTLKCLYTCLQEK